MGDVLEERTVAAAADRGPYDLVLAVDVACYFGALEPLLDVFEFLAKPGGDVVVSVERAGDDAEDWALAETGRYKHDVRYVIRAAAAAGLECLERRGLSGTGRTEDGEPVRVTVLCLTKPDPANAPPTPPDGDHPVVEAEAPPPVPPAAAPPRARTAAPGLRASTPPAGPRTAATSPRQLKLQRPGSSTARARPAARPATTPEARRPLPGLPRATPSFPSVR